MAAYYRVFFKEEQKLKFVWIFLFLAILSFIFLFYVLFQQLILHKPWGSEPMPDSGLILVNIIIPLFLFSFYLIFRNSKLIIEVKEDGIYLRYPPQIIKNQIFKFENIEKYYLRNYNAIKEYGGRGAKAIRPKAGISYSVSGNKGIQLILLDGTKILIGTQKAQEFLMAIKKGKSKRI